MTDDGLFSKLGKMLEHDKEAIQHAVSELKQAGSEALSNAEAKLGTALVNKAHEDEVYRPASTPVDAKVKPTVSSGKTHYI